MRSRVLSTFSKRIRPSLSTTRVRPIWRPPSQSVPPRSRSMQKTQSPGRTIGVFRVVSVTGDLVLPAFVPSPDQAFLGGQPDIAHATFINGVDLAGIHFRGCEITELCCLPIGPGQARSPATNPQQVLPVDEEGEQLILGQAAGSFGIGYMVVDGETSLVSLQGVESVVVGRHPKTTLAVFHHIAGDGALQRGAFQQGRFKA